MKRKGWITERIAELRNLQLAYWKAKRGKSAQQEVLQFSQPTLEVNLIRLRQQILDGEVDVGNYHYFKVFDPKERLICAAPFPQRVLHHAIMNICHDDFDRFQIFDSYASRKGKGTYAALNRAMSFQRKYRFCMKLDARKFFDSIDHDVMYGLLTRMYKDKRLLTIFRRIIESYESSPGKGLPIGNLTSQYFANHYLAVLDHKAKEDYKAVAYVRYMDDIMVWDNDKTVLKDIGVNIRDYLNTQLKLCLKEMILKSTVQNTTFLGYQLSKTGLRLSRRSVARYKHHIKELYYEYDNGTINQEQMLQRLQPVLAFVYKANSEGIRKSVMQQL